MKECLEDKLLNINLLSFIINQGQLQYNNNFIKLIITKDNIILVLNPSLEIFKCLNQNANNFLFELRKNLEMKKGV